MRNERLTWERAGMQEDRYALRLVDPDRLDRRRVTRLLNAVVEAEGVGRPFSQAGEERWREWLADPSRPLHSSAIGLLSNWFLTSQAGARNSPRGHAARQLWNALFAAEPEQRLTDVDQNEVIDEPAFEAWWNAQELCQRQQSHGARASAGSEERVSEFVGVGGGAVMGIGGTMGAISATGSVAGFSAAGITSGLAAIGGGTMLGGLLAVGAIPIAGAAAGYGLVKGIKALVRAKCWGGSPEDGAGETDAGDPDNPGEL